jgi:hypothetical protein
MSVSKISVCRMSVCGMSVHLQDECVEVESVWDECALAG